LKPFKRECGADALDGTAAPRERDAWFPIAFWNFARILSVLRSSTAASKMFPS